MSLNQTASTARLPRFAGSAPEAQLTRGPTRPGYLRHLMLDVRRMRSAIGLLGFVVLSAGILLAGACTAWGLQMGMAFPAAIAIGYCMLGCSACLCAALTVILGSAAKTNQISETSEPNYAAWKVAKKFRVSDASRLWCNIEPGCAASQESLAWAQAMFNAVKSGELAVSEGAGASREIMDRDRINPSWATEIERGALKSWAAAHGHTPLFLQG